jgi:hypothetical protein
MLDINKLKTGYKVTFGEKVEKIVCHTCGDNNQIRSVSFTDGTILERDDSLWELAELTELEVIWERDGCEGLAGYESGEHKANRFYINRGFSKFVLAEYITFPSEDTARIYANKRLKMWRSSCGN